MRMPKLQKTEDRFFITIPKNMVDKKGWKKGQDLLFTWNERGNIEIHDQEVCKMSDVKKEKEKISQKDRLVIFLSIVAVFISLCALYMVQIGRM